MKNFKQSLLPLGVLVLGVAAAFASQKENSPQAVVTGYASVENPCDMDILCQDDGGPLCSVWLNGVEHQAFGKDVVTQECNIQLYRLF